MARALALALLVLLALPAGAPRAEEELPWSWDCTATERAAEPDCEMRQRAFVTETGQLLMLLTLRVPGTTREPVMILQAPVSTYLPAGIRLDVDGGEGTTLEYQTCDGQGCYSATAVSAELLEALRGGSKLNLTIEDQQRRSLVIPLSLSGFTAVYQRIQ
jgi:invasion protein IalB